MNEYICLVFGLAFSVVFTSGFPVKNVHQNGRRSIRSFNDAMEKLSKKSENFAMGAMKLLLPSNQISPGLASLRNLVKRQAAADATPVNTVQAAPVASPMLPNMYQIPAYQGAQFAYPIYQNPYLSNLFFSQYGANKRTFPSFTPPGAVPAGTFSAGAVPAYPTALNQPLAYQIAFNQPMDVPVQQAAAVQPSTTTGPVAGVQPLATPDAVAAPVAAAVAPVVPPIQAEPIQPELPNKKKDKIMNEMDDVEQNADGFDKAVKNYKIASIIRKRNDIAELTEKVNDEVIVNKSATKRDKEGKKERFTNFFKAYKKTMDDRNTLESKLVNYFTDYVCGDDC